MRGRRSKLGSGCGFVLLGFSIAFLALVTLVSVRGALVLILEAGPWGWSLPSDVTGAILLLYMAGSLALAAHVLARTPSVPVRTAVYLSVLGLTSLAVTFFLFNYSPHGPPQEEMLQGLGVSPARMKSLSGCDQVAMFAEVGYRSIDLHHDMVLTPRWMDEALAELPECTLAACLADAIRQRLPYLIGDSRERQVASMQVLALAMKARELGVAGDPTILELERTVICQLDADPTRRISIAYYVGQHGWRPGASYLLSTEGEQRLKNEVCQAP